LSAEERNATEVLASVVATVAAAGVLSKRSRAATCTEAAVTEITTASTAEGNNESRPARKAARSKDSTVPATVKSALTTLM
jgi:hypothetical protein